MQMCQGTCPVLAADWQRIDREPGDRNPATCRDNTFFVTSLTFGHDGSQSDIESGVSNQSCWAIATTGAMEAMFLSGISVVWMEKTVISFRQTNIFLKLLQ